MTVTARTDVLGHHNRMLTATRKLKQDEIDEVIARAERISAKIKARRNFIDGYTGKS